ncbi:efflux RND transporter periplasmic adaptor subunit [Cohnella rhizosphaerae]|uniref:Biotin/lipoyl-binding protein n=1 Tax=Cohnella rhizosphaerae TaxID=1457232 RepID=A0A9X4KQ26_9BACL|nr:biotin/lipoyl-binding protein [Cohnella rhizosphaerae]MDG0809029.1 biotin/lipoyl-binding protein [Cohnella rhizosphaerae]
MDTEAAGAGQKLRQRRIRMAAGVFAGLLVALTLLGNTLLALTLPKVAVQPVQSGRVKTQYDGTGVVQPVETLSLPNPAGWKVKQVLAKEGDRVHQGQALVTYDDRDARDQIEAQQASLQKLKLQIPLLQQQYIQAAKDGGAADVAGAKSALESAEIDIAAQQQLIAGLQADMAEKGKLVAPVDGIVKEVHALAGTAGVSAGPDVLLVSSGRGYRFELRPPASLAETLRVGDKLEAQVQAQGGGQEDEGQGEVQGEGEGQDEVKGKAQGEEQGQEQEQGQMKGDMQDGDPHTIHGVVTEILQDLPGSDGSGGGEEEDGAVSSVPGYRIVVKLTDASIRGGETVKVHLEKDASDTDTMLVPSAAVRRDGAGAYVLVIEERQGPLGNAYYASRRSVSVKETGDGMSAVSGSLFEGDRMIVESEEPLSEGERVRI